jgi:hypothetical protein
MKIMKDIMSIKLVEVYLRTMIREEVKPAINTILRRADSTIEAIGSRRKTAALSLLVADTIPGVIAVQNGYHNEVVTAITLAIVAPPLYAFEYYCVQYVMAGYHRWKEDRAKRKGTDTTGPNPFYFRS